MQFLEKSYFVSNNISENLFLNVPVLFYTFRFLRLQVYILHSLEIEIYKNNNTAKAIKLFIFFCLSVI